MLMKTKFLLTASVSFSLIFLMLYHQGNNNKTDDSNFSDSTDLLLKEEDDQSSEIKKEWLKQTKLCIINLIRETDSAAVWPKLHRMINKCSSVHESAEKQFIRFTKTYKDKFFLPFKKSAPVDHPCNVVSLGIGGEIEMEEQLRKLYPFCKFFGADPFLEAAEIYSKVGKFYVTAVDDNNGERVLSTLRGEKYSWNKVNVTSFGTFLNDILKINFVHYLSMDVEGSEYRLLPYLSNNSLFRKESGNATVCQISAEFHGHLTYYNYTNVQFKLLFINFLSNSPFVPLRAHLPSDHHYVFFMNSESDYCMDLFYV